MMFNADAHLIDLKGKKYLQVMWRLVWFRTEKPLWSIDTKLEQLTENHAVFSAKIYDENGVQKSAGYGSESIKDFRDYIEKAETKAVGRALAMLGYGTQFSPELDEGERIADSPVDVPLKKEQRRIICERCGSEVYPVKKRNGEIWSVSETETYSKKIFGACLCADCMKAVQKERGNAG